MKKLSILLVMLAMNCTYNWGTFREYSLEAPTNLEAVGSGTVQGEDCGTMIFWCLLWTQSFTGAVKDALRKAPGATGLKDVTLTAKHGVNLIFACMYVEGTPVKDSAGGATPASPAKTKTNKK